MLRVLDSPRRVALLALLAFLALDLARSVHSHLAFSTPYAEWDPPGSYERISWPPGRDAPAGASLGARVFAERCAVCHGPGGRGNGPAAPSIHPRPRDLTAGELKYRTTPAYGPPSSADVLRVVRDGLPASAMPYFRDLLGEEEQRAVVAHVRQLMGASGPDEPPVRVAPPPAPDQASLRRGEELYERACAACHGADLRGGGLYEDRPGSRVRARDLTAPWTFRGGATPEQLWLRLTTGMVPGPMPSYADSLDPGQRWDIVHFVTSRARPAPGEPGSVLAGPGQSPDRLLRGDYLIRAEMCGLCHTQIDRSGIYRDEGYFLAGGMRVGAGAHGVFVSRNLTGDAETGLGPQSEAEVARTLRTGRRADRTLDPWGMPWWFFHAFSEEDALSIAGALKALPPVKNWVPDPLPRGFLEAALGKLATPLPTATPAVLTYADGDFADPQARPGWMRSAPADALLWAERLVVLAGAALWAVARWRTRARRPPRGPGRRLLAALGAAAGAVALLLLWGMSGVPQIFPAPRLAEGATHGLHLPTPAELGSPERAALVERGRYLFTVTSCAFCHTAGGEGGPKISWKSLGTLWVRNITSDRETGIGEWSDAEVARAIRSGISRRGRALHWQGMPWDQLGNLDEEDVRAVVAYLRTVPPVRRAIAEPSPPAPDDCAIYSFFLGGDLGRPGCR
jgi:mono/diheme cytochrome c family protein